MIGKIYNEKLEALAKEVYNSELPFIYDGIAQRLTEKNPFERVSFTDETGCIKFGLFTPTYKSNNIYFDVTDNCNDSIGNHGIIFRSERIATSLQEVKVLYKEAMDIRSEFV